MSVSQAAQFTKHKTKIDKDGNVIEDIVIPAGQSEMSVLQEQRRARLGL